MQKAGRLLTAFDGFCLTMEFNGYKHPTYVLYCPTPYKADFRLRTATKWPMLDLAIRLTYQNKDIDVGNT
jgi:hypothetical protein